jgi:hypothetical protein
MHHIDPHRLDDASWMVCVDGFFQIPPDLVVNLKSLILFVLFYHSSGGKHRQQHRVDQGNRALSCSHYLRVIGLPLNSMESGNCRYGDQRAPWPLIVPQGCVCVTRLCRAWRSVGGSDRPLSSQCRTAHRSRAPTVLWRCIAPAHGRLGGGGGLSGQPFQHVP